MARKSGKSPSPKAPKAASTRGRGKKPEPAPAEPAAAPAAAIEATMEAPFDPADAIEIDLASDEGGPASTRRAERIRLDEEVEIRGLFGDGMRADRVRDASLNGVFVETAHPLEVGDPVTLGFHLDDGKTLRVTGRVRWVTPFGGIRDATPGMGIELVGLGGEARTALGALLTRKKRGLIPSNHGP